MRRKIIRIDEAKCNGCGKCAAACAEGAIAMVDGKARLVSDVYCDGLGACIGGCPVDAIAIEEREAAVFDPKAAEHHLSRERTPAPSAHRHGDGVFACPGSAARSLPAPVAPGPDHTPVQSRLRNWPVQLHLVPLSAPYLQGARLLVSADCVPFALPGFHAELLAGRVLLVGCPKLDDTDPYLEKLTSLFQANDIQSVEVATMEVPCCHGLVQVVRQAIAASGKAVPLSLIQVSIQGRIRERAGAPPPAAGPELV